MFTSANLLLPMLSFRICLCFGRRPRSGLLCFCFGSRRFFRVYFQKTIVSRCFVSASNRICLNNETHRKITEIIFLPSLSIGKFPRTDVVLLNKIFPVILIISFTILPDLPQHSISPVFDEHKHNEPPDSFHPFWHVSIFYYRRVYYAHVIIQT